MFYNQSFPWPHYRPLQGNKLFCPIIGFLAPIRKQYLNAQQLSQAPWSFTGVT